MHTTLHTVLWSHPYPVDEIKFTIHCNYYIKLYVVPWIVTEVFMVVFITHEGAFYAQIHIHSIVPCIEY